MKKSILLTLVLIILLFVSCTTVDKLALIPVEDKKTQNFIQGSTAFSAKTKGDVQMIVAPENFTGSTMDVLISIAHTEKGTFKFRDDYIYLYGGNHEKNNWTLLAKWDSASFIQKEIQKKTSAKVAAGILGTIAIVDAIVNNETTDLLFDFALDATLLQSEYSSLGAALYLSSDLSPLGAIVLIDTALAINQLKSMHDAEINNSIIKVPSTLDISSVSGKVFFDNIGKYPDYKIVFKNDKQDFSFIYSRTDRDEIINPWKDKTSSIASVNYNYTFALKRHSITFNLLEPRLFGLNAGFSFKECRDDLILGTSFGLNCKIQEYSWISASIELSDIENRLDLLGTLGFNVCANMISLYAGTVYQDGHFYFETGAGFTF